MRGTRSGGEGRGREGWKAWALLREAIRRLHHGYESLPVSARRAWWASLAAGFLLVELFTLGLVWGTRRLAAAGALGWERAAVLRFEEWAPISFSTAMWIEGLGNGFVLWAVMLFSAGVAAWHRRPLRALAFLVGYTGLYFVIATGWTAWPRDRPSLIAGGVGSPGGFFNSFPSGHLIQTTFAYGVLVYLWVRAARSAGERATALLAVSLVVALTGLSRLRLGAHWPSDLVAGALIGIAWTGAVIVALRRAERHLGPPGEAPTPPPPR